MAQKAYNHKVIPLYGKNEDFVLDETHISNIADHEARIANLEGGGGSGGPVASAAPTTGSHSIGEFVRNSNPSEQGTTGAKFIISGWTCVAAGTPGTWVANNVFTGN